MADRVPYTGYSEAAGAQAPRFEPTPEMHVEATPAAFGVNVAQAAQNLGSVQEGAGKEIFQRALAFQDLTNHATARGASVKTAQEQAQLWAEFDAKGGMAAGPEALKKLQQDLDQIRVKNGAGLNPMAQELYQNDAASLQSRLYIYSASHSAQSLKQYDLETIKANRETANNLVEGTAHRGDAEVDRAYATNQSSAVLESHHLGVPTDSDITKNKIVQYNSETTLHAIKGFIDRHDPEGAQKFFDDAEKKGRIVGQWSDQAQKMIEGSMKSVGARQAADSTYDPNKSEAENVAAARAAAQKIAPGDADVADRAISITARNTTIDKSIRTQQFQRADSTIDRIIAKMHESAPESLRDLMQDPEFKSAYDVLSADPEKGGQVDQMINDRIIKTVRSDNDLTPERSLAAQRLIGEAHEDPSAFVKEDLWKMNLTMDQRKELLRLQEGMRTSGTAGFRDRATERVMGDFRQQIRDAIGERGTPEYNEFRGALQQELDFAREGGKVITPDMANEIATKLLQDKVLTPKWHGVPLTGKAGHVYQPSDAEAAAIRSQLGTNLTDDQVQRIYLKKLNDVLINKGPANAPR